MPLEKLPYRDKNGFQFDHDWRIKRNGTKVSFGCGRVEVKKSDLLLIANNKKVFDALRRVSAAASRERSRYSVEALMRIDSALLRKIAGPVKKKLAKVVPITKAYKKRK